MKTLERCLQVSRSGPWGTLEYYYLFLDPPDHLFAQHHLSSKTEWFFPNCDRTEVASILEKAGISLQLLERASTATAAKGGFLLHPRHEQLLELDARQRQRFYPGLIKLTDRSHPLNCFVIDRGKFRENAFGLEIPESIIQLIEDRCVTVGKKTLFPETPLVLSMIDDAATQLSVLKALSRARSLVARLRIDDTMDLKEIAGWWAAGPNRSRALPLFEAALRMQGVDSIDLIHLLPPVPRRMLNTYPDRRDAISSNPPDCYWAAMNFFSETASSRYLDSSLPRQYYFLERFDKVDGPRQFGDVIIIADPAENRFVHAYIHVADDIVYTKNGNGRFFPFILMREGDLLARYIESEQMVTDVFRIRS